MNSDKNWGIECSANNGRQFICSVPGSFCWSLSCADDGRVYESMVPRVRGSFYVETIFETWNNNILINHELFLLKTVQSQMTRCYFKSNAMFHIKFQARFKCLILHRVWWEVLTAAGCCILSEMIKAERVGIAVRRCVEFHWNLCLEWTNNRPQLITRQIRA